MLHTATLQIGAHLQVDWIAGKRIKVIQAIRKHYRRLMPLNAVGELNRESPGVVWEDILTDIDGLGGVGGHADLDDVVSVVVHLEVVVCEKVVSKVG